MKRLILTGLITLSLNGFGQAVTVAEQLAFGTYISWTGADAIMGRNVSFLEHLPVAHPSGDDPSLIIYLHGDGEKSVTAEASHRFTDQTDAENFIMVYLDQAFSTVMPVADPDEFDSWLGGMWDVDGSDDDFHEAYISAIIDHYVDNHNANPRKVYLVGSSGGGMIVLDMVPLMFNKIAAFGVHAGNNRIGNLPSYTLPAGGTAPVMIIQGDADNRVLYGSTGSARGRTYTSTLTTMNQLATYNGYPTGLPAAAATINTDPSDGCTVNRFIYGENLELLRLNSGGHTWPGTDMDIAAVDAAFAAVGFPVTFEEFIGPEICYDISATDEFLNFFSDKTLECDNIAIWDIWAGLSYPIDFGDYYSFYGHIYRKQVGPNPYLGNICAPGMTQEEQADFETNLQTIDDLNDGIAIYPNPTNDIVTVNLQNLPFEPTMISLSDLNGRIINRISLDRSYESPNNQVELDLNNLTPGIYLVQVQVGEMNIQEKIVKN